MPRFLRLMSRLITLGLILVLGCAVCLPVANVQARQDATPAPAAEAVADLPTLLSACDSIFGVMILNPDGSTLFEQNADLPFVSASLYKLVLITEILARVEEGEVSLTDTVELLPDFFLAENGDDSFFGYESVGYLAPIEELLYSAGSYSSNVGAHALLSLTSPEALEEFAGEIGLPNTRYWLVAGEAIDLYADGEQTSADNDFIRSIAFVDSFAGSSTVNVTTPRDMATFFDMVSTDTLVSPLVSWRVKQVLSARVINDRLPALLPSDVPVIHKTGNLYGVLHDAGIIETPDGPMVVVAMAQAVTNVDTTFSVEQRIGLFAYESGGGEPGRPSPDSTPDVVGVIPVRQIVTSGFS